MTMSSSPWARLGFALVIVGLLIQIAAALFWGPGTFILSAALGLPLVVAGTIGIVVAIRRAGAGPGKAVPHAPD
jgi:mannose/fructose/N-acetylgalactosamine-specific phosphotransferase system component IIC